jgi:DNA modification methylase
MMKVKISAIKANSKNPRVIKDDKFKKLVKSIQEFPEMLEKRPLVCYTDVDGKYVVLGGNMRLKASQEIGLKELPIVLADDWTQEQRDEFLIKDNVGFGEWDWDQLANEWDADKLDDWGLDVPNFDGEVLEAEEDDFDTTPPLEPITVLGDLYEIGEHRLLCGDSTDSDQVAKLMNGQKANMVFTDPPYGISVVSNNKVGGDKIPTFSGVVGGGAGATKKGQNKIVDAKIYSAIIGDDTTDTAKQFYQTCISLGMENFIIWGGNYFTDFLPVSSCWLIWDKENSGNFADVEIAWTSFNKGSKLYKWLWNGMSRKGSREIEGKTRVHPTQKPVGLFGDIFNEFQFKICFDGFLGSGSTMVASHQLKRKCYGMELDPKYCDVIVNRMIALDPDIEIKLNGKPFEKTH